MRVLVSGKKGVLAKALDKASYHESFGNLEQLMLLVSVVEEVLRLRIFLRTMFIAESMVIIRKKLRLNHLIIMGYLN